MALEPEKKKSRTGSTQTASMKKNQPHPPPAPAPCTAASRCARTSHRRPLQARCPAPPRRPWLRGGEGGLCVEPGWLGLAGEAGQQHARVLPCCYVACLGSGLAQPRIEMGDKLQPPSTHKSPAPHLHSSPALSPPPRGARSGGAPAQTRSLQAHRPARAGSGAPLAGHDWRPDAHNMAHTLFSRSGQRGRARPAKPGSAAMPGGTHSCACWRTSAPAAPGACPGSPAGRASGSAGRETMAVGSRGAGVSAVALTQPCSHAEHQRGGTPTRPLRHHALGPRPRCARRARLQQRQVAHDGQVVLIHAQRVLVALDGLVVLAVAAVQQAAGPGGQGGAGKGATVTGTGFGEWVCGRCGTAARGTAAHQGNAVWRSPPKSPAAQPQHAAAASSAAAAAASAGWEGGLTRRHASTRGSAGRP